MTSVRLLEKLTHVDDRGLRRLRDRRPRGEAVVDALVHPVRGLDAELGQLSGCPAARPSLRHGDDILRLDRGILPA